MKKDSKHCFNCEGANGDENEELFGYTICNTCKSKLGLFHDATIKKHSSLFKMSKERDPNSPSYEEEIHNRLIYLDKDHVRKKIKLLHVQERLKHIN